MFAPPLARRTRRQHQGTPESRASSHKRVRRDTAKPVSADTVGQKAIQNKYDLNTPHNESKRAKATTRQTLRTPTFERRKGIDAISIDTQRRNEIQKSTWHEDAADAKTAKFH